MLVAIRLVFVWYCRLCLYLFIIFMFCLFSIITVVRSLRIVSCRGLAGGLLVGGGRGA